MSMLKGSLPFVSLGNQKPFPAIRLDWKQKPSSKITNGSMNYELCPGNFKWPQISTSGHTLSLWGSSPALAGSCCNCNQVLQSSQLKRSMKSARILCRVVKVGSQRVVNRHLTPPFQGDPENQILGHPLSWLVYLQLLAESKCNWNQLVQLQHQILQSSQFKRSMRSVKSTLKWAICLNKKSE